MNEKETWKINLYVAGNSAAALQPRAELTAIFEGHDTVSAEITVIDLLSQPEEAAANDILAIPTLIRQSPPPPLRLIGDLTDHTKVLQVMGL